MTTTKKQHSPQFKARVVIEAIRGQKTLSQLGSQFKVHPIQIAKWRKAALEQMPELFVDGRTRKSRDGEADSNARYEEIGRLKVELDWLKKKWGCSTRGTARASGTGPSRPQCPTAMRVAGRQPRRLVLRTSGRKRRELAADEIAGRTLHTGAVLRQPEDDRVACHTRARSESQTDLAADASDGTGGRLSEAEAEPAGRRPQDLPVPAERRDGGARQSGVEHGHHVHPDGAGLRLPGGGDGLVQPVRPELVAVIDIGNRLLQIGRSSC